MTWVFNGYQKKKKLRKVEKFTINFFFSIYKSEKENFFF